MNQQQPDYPTIFIFFVAGLLATALMWELWPLVFILPLFGYLVDLLDRKLK